MPRSPFRNCCASAPRCMATRSRCARRNTASGIRYSWNHYYETARAVALGLLSLGIKPGDRVAIAGENTPEWFYADLGVQMIGAVAVGIYPTNPWVELQYIVKHSGSRVVITGDQEQTDKVLDAMANNDGLPALEAVVCIDMKGLRNYRQSQLMSFEQLCDRGRALRARKPRRQRHAGPADLARRARRRLHPRLHLGHHRPAQGRDAHPSQSGLRGLDLRRSRRDRRQAVRGRELSAAVPRRRALLWRGDASGARRRRQLCGIDRYRRDQYPRDRADLLRRRAPHLRKAAAEFSVQARRERKVAAGHCEGLHGLGPQTLGPPAGRNRHMVRPRSPTRCSTC